MTSRVRLRPAEAAADGAAGRRRGLSRHEVARVTSRPATLPGRQRAAAAGAGSRTNRVPPRALRSTRRAAVRLGHGPDDRQPEPRPLPPLPPAAHEALEDAAARSPRECQAPRPAPPARHAVVAAWRADVRPGRRVNDGVLDQVQRQPVELVPSPRAPSRARIDRQLVTVGHRADSPAASRSTSPGRWPCARTRPASARASSSRSPTSLRIRRVERSADWRCPRARPELLGEQLQVGQHAGQRGAQLVRGVGHELALAIERRLGLRARRVQRAQHLLQRARQLGHLVVGLGLGQRQFGSRVRSISRAAAVSCGDRATWRAGRWPGPPAAPAPFRRARRRAGRSWTLARVWSMSESGRA